MRQRLPLGLEARHDLLGVHAQFDDLKRDAAANRDFLFCHIDHSETALPDLLQKLVRADLVAGTLGEQDGEGVLFLFADRSGQGVRQSATCADTTRRIWQPFCSTARAWVQWVSWSVHAEWKRKMASKVTF